MQTFQNNKIIRIIGGIWYSYQNSDDFHAVGYIYFGSLVLPLHVSEVTAAFSWGFSFLFFLVDLHSSTFCSFFPACPIAHCIVSVRVTKVL